MTLTTGVDPLTRAMSAAVSRVHLPGSVGYLALAATEEARHRPGPALVVEALTAHDVAAAVRTAGSLSVPVAVRGTGRDAVPPGCVLIATQSLETLVVRPHDRTAQLGAGVRWATALHGAARHGLAPVCGADAAGAAVAHLASGGLGPVARTFGVSSDRIHELEVVTGDGVLRKVSATSDPELFWGLRGGRGSLGIITSAQIELVEQPEVYAGTLWFDEADVAQVLRAWARWATRLPPEGTTSVAVARMASVPHVPAALAGFTTLALRFAWTGSPVQGERQIEPLREVAEPLIDTVGVLPYAAIGAVHADHAAPGPHQRHNALLDGLGPAAVDRLLELVGPGSGCCQQSVEVRRLGGAVRETLRGPSAVAHRDAPWSLTTVGTASAGVPDPVADDARRIAQGMADWVRPGALAGLDDGSGRVWADRVFGASAAARLREAAGRYDPAGTLLAGRALGR
ncbi:MAG: FAD-binding protein [Actinobacteria bacterium]|nr:FAD-binding protein [Actinomycetota bacterium]MCG2801999.1 FAD-binding protein [Cellulomonas sp.]